MDQRQKEILQLQLDNEKRVIKALKQVYAQALTDCEKKICELSGRKDMENLQSIIYQRRYQEAIKAQLEGILEQLRSNEYSTISDYLSGCYEDGYIGVMYDLHGQGIPLVVPIDQKQTVQAVQTDSKISTGLYTRLGEDVKRLKTSIRAELSRGIANGSTWNEIAGKLARGMKNTPFNRAYNNAVRIARTEGHRIQIEAADHAQHEAKEKGADVVKQWDATLDGKTRDSHRMVDGEIRELDEKFSNGLMYPGDSSGGAAEVVNCRCALLQRAKWNLGKEELNTLKKRAEYFGLDKTKNFEEYKEKYLKASDDMVMKFKISFPDDVYKIDGFTESVKKEVDRAMEKLNNEYNINLNSIVVESAEKGDIFVTGYHDGVVDMIVNKDADFNKIIRQIDKRYNDGYYAGKSLEDYLAHEMAHCMLYQDCKTNAVYNAKHKQVESLYSSLKGISGYADKKQSGNEALAEAFVRLRNKEEIPTVAKVLVKSYFGKWKKKN